MWRACRSSSTGAVGVASRTGTRRTRGWPTPSRRSARSWTTIRPTLRRTKPPPWSASCSATTISRPTSAPSWVPARNDRSAATISSMRGAASWSGWRRATRSSSCSRTCTGRTRDSSISSSTPPISRKVRSCCSRSPARSSSRRGRGGAVGNAMPPPSTSIRSRPTRAVRCWRICSAPISPADVRDLIVERSEGNPLYVEEIVRMLIDGGVLRATEASRWEVARPVADVEVPRSIQGLIAARLDGLPG